MIKLSYIFLISITFFLILAFYQKRYHKKLLILFGKELIPQRAFVGVKLIKFAFLFFAFLLVLVLIYLPRQKIDPEQFVIPKKKLVIVMDTSETLSINKSDQQTWFDFSSLLAQRILSSMELSFETAVIHQSSYAKLISPSSLDLGSSQLAIQSLFVGSQINRTIKTSTFKLIDEISNQGIHTLVLVFTDGNSLPLISPKTIKSLKRKSVSVIFIGLGDFVPTPIPVLNHRGVMVDYLKNGNGSTRLSSQNTENLKALASTLKGVYLPILKEENLENSFTLLFGQVLSQYQKLMSLEFSAQKKPKYTVYLLFVFIILLLEELVVVRKGHLK